MEYIEQDLSKEEQDVHSSGTSVIPSYKPEPNPASIRKQVMGSIQTPWQRVSLTPRCTPGTCNEDRL